MTPDSSEATMLEHFEHMKSQIAVWKDFAQRPPAGSAERPLGIDADAGVPEVAEIAWHGVLTAIDHLLLIRDAAEYNAGRPARLLANHTAARGALLPACRTIWILSATDPTERRRRAFGVAIQDAEGAQKATEEARQRWPDNPAVAAEAREAADEVDNLHSRCSELGLTAAKLNDTEVVGAAAAFVNDAHPELAAALPTSWRRMSGFAHGYLWTGRLAFRNPNVVDVISSIGAAVLCTQVAIELMVDSTWSVDDDTGDTGDTGS